ncbi:MAG TPA: hypothetical protein VF623_00115 [Segetibacter sp.]
MKTKLSIVLLFILTSAISNAQFYKAVLPSPEFTTALEKVVLDFRFNFENIKGSSLADEGDVRTFESSVNLPGAKQCLIRYFNSLQDTTASWQAIMYDGEDYKEAKKVYENAFRLVKKSQIKWIDKSLKGFTGELEAPKEAVRFTLSTLNFDLDDEKYKWILAEVEMVSTYSGWVVHLNLHAKSEKQ